MNRFALKGVHMSLVDIANHIVADYANANPKMSAQDIRNYFVNICDGVGASHIVETENEYHMRDGQISQARTVSEVTIPNGEKLYVTTQWRGNGNFLKFMDVVNKNKLGHIVKI